MNRFFRMLILSRFVRAEDLGRLSVLFQEKTETIHYVCYKNFLFHYTISVPSASSGTSASSFLA